MNLIDFTKVNQFNALRIKMNADFIEWGETSWKKRKIDSLIDSGDYVVTDLGELTIGKSGIIQHNGRAVIVYIPYGRNYKFHMANCSTLESMKHQGRYDRYILTRRTDGKFKVKTKYKEDYFRLSACKNCLGLLGYSWSLADNFDIKGHFKKYDSLNSKSKIPKPTSTDTFIPNDTYNEDWEKTSKKKRENENYICSKCKIDLSNPRHRKFLHVHHINGLKSDDSFINLLCLCIECHSKEPKHGHMKVPQEFKNIREKLGY